jgi:hypothetical protein
MSKVFSNVPFLTLMADNSVLCQKLADKVSPLRTTAPQPRQGRNPASAGPGRKPWGTEPSPRLRLPSPARAGEGTGVREGSVTRPTAHAVGYVLSPAPRADFINEPLTQDVSAITAFRFNNLLASPRLPRNPFIFKHSSRSTVSSFLFPCFFNNSLSFHQHRVRKAITCFLSTTSWKTHKRSFFLHLFSITW